MQAQCYSSQFLMSCLMILLIMSYLLLNCTNSIIWELKLSHVFIPSTNLMSTSGIRNCLCGCRFLVQEMAKSLLSQNIHYFIKQVETVNEQMNKYFMSGDGKCCAEKQSRINRCDNEINVNMLKPTMFFSVLNIQLPTAINSVLLSVKYYHIFIQQGHSGIFNTNLLCVK